MDTDLIEQLADAVHGDLWPDLTLLLDAPVAVGQTRRSQRGPADRIEAESSAFFERARATYLDRQRRDPDRVKLVDATRPLEEVQQIIFGHLDQLLFNMN